MKACFSQSTAHSLKITIKAGLNIVCNKEKVGRDGTVRVREKDAGRKEKSEEEEAEDNSIKFLNAIINNISAN